MATTTLLCKQCNFENEPERVYCHNCGAKLDRSLLPPEATKREDPIIVQERVRKMVKPKRVSMGKQVRNLFLSVILAALFAAIIVVIRPPDGIPTVSQEAVTTAPPITDELDGAIQDAAPHKLIYTEDQVNAFLQTSIHGKDDGVIGIPVKFEHAYVHFDEGICRIITQQSIAGLSLYTATTHTVEVRNGEIATRSIGGSFGRLPVSGLIMRYLEAPFSPLWKALEHNRQQVSRLQSISFHKGSVEMITKPANGG